MPHYSVVQWEDTLREERINVGVVAWDKEEIVTRFLVHWERAEIFAGYRFDPETLLLPFRDLTFAKLLYLLSCGGSGCLRMTLPRGSLCGVHDLLASEAARFLVDGP